MTKHKLNAPPDYEHNYVAKDYQVCVRIIEARHLFGLELNPYVTVQVGQETKKTQTKSLTNSPFYDEYFVFEFNMPACQFFDQVIMFVAESRKVIFNKQIGVFKIDIATVYAEEYHGFFHKWALLVNPSEPHGGAKGYVKCDIVVNQKGEVVSFPPIPVNSEEEEIDENLLMPEGTTFESTPAQYMFCFYHGQDIISLDERDNLSLVQTKDNIPQRVSPYIRVLFAGLSGKTSVRKRTVNPVWNESIVMIHTFPPLLRRIKIQVRDEVSNTVIATTFLDLSTMSDESQQGYLPTFGPAYLNLYGGLKKDPFHNKNPLNFGLGDGVYYRGRIFLSFDVMQVEQVSRSFLFFKRKTKGKKFSSVVTGPLKRSQLVQVDQLGRTDEFFLYCCIFEALGIDNKHLDKKPMYFELSLGHHGKVLDGCHPQSLKDPLDDGLSDSESDISEDLPRERRRNAAIMQTDKALQGLAVGALCLIDETEIEDEKMSFRSRTEPLQAVLTDEFYCMLPYYESKPCLFIRSPWPNDKRRLLSANIIENLAQKFDTNLNIIEDMAMLHMTAAAVARLKLVLNQLVADSRFCFSLIQKDIDVSDSDLSQQNIRNSDVPFLTELDVKRFFSLKKELELISAEVDKTIQTLCESNLNAALNRCRKITGLIRKYTPDPQQSIPDIFLWLCSGDERLAYTRVTASSVVYSPMDEERGKLCGKVTSFFMKRPVTSQNQEDDDLWEPQAEVTVMFWLGMSEETGNMKEGYISNLPKGFKPWCDFRKFEMKERCVIIPPKELKYQHSGIYELRCHFYMARDLLGLDDSGLSDPFARVIFRGCTGTTQYLEQTLNPHWNEMLVFPGIQIYGTPTDIQRNPPKLAVQVFDHDMFGKNELIGDFDALIEAVKLADEKYAAPKFPPPLKWYRLRRLEDKAGEILAAFELLEVCDDFREEVYYPPLPQPEPGFHGPKLPLPAYICPKLSRFYIEVLFWGLRDIKSSSGGAFVAPMVEIEVAGQILRSEVMSSYKTNPNFTEMRKFFDVVLPDSFLYRPPIVIRSVSCHSFGRTTLIGSYTVARLDKSFLVETEQQKNIERRKSNFTSISMIEDDDDEQEETSNEDIRGSKSSLLSKPSSRISLLKKRLQQKLNENAKKNGSNDGSRVDSGEFDEENEQENEDDEDEDENENAENANEGGDDEENQEKLDDEVNVIKDTASSVMDEKLAEKKQKQEMDKAARAEKFKRDNIMLSYDWWTKYSMSVEQFHGGRNANKLKPRSAAGMLLKKKLLRKAKAKLKDLGEAGMSFVNKAFSRDNQNDLPELMDASDRPDSKFARYLKIYPHELEEVPEFENFEDEFRTFPLYRGKQVVGMDNDSRIVGKFKGNLKLCKFPVPKELQETGFFTTLPKNELTPLVVRVYAVKAQGLVPIDGGKPDPYLVVKIGSKQVSDKKNHHVSTLHPTFGRCFELSCNLPEETELIVQVWDWSRVHMDQLIGETKIDLENRYYSKHRATCGISQEYDMVGYNEWRDGMRPSLILEDMCYRYGLRIPEYSPHQVKVAGITFTRPNATKDETTHMDTERTALYVLNNWHRIPALGCHLVPEHVETRPLFNPDRPGIEQGRLEMWVDIFSADGVGPGGIVEITPRKPEEYELRVIVHDTKNVPLNDYNMLEGLRMSDIYVKGFITNEAIQATDVHYRSLNGEGNFNWRFKFKFKYLPTEDKIVIKKRENVFSIAEADTLQPCRLTLQVWDAETLTGDDQLGTLELNLSRFPRGKKVSSNCSWRMFDPTEKVHKVSLFKLKRMRGWWPFISHDKNGQMTDAGKVDLELELVSEEDACKNPVGLGRNEPYGLSPPKRPDTSFAWFTSPLKLLRFGVWDNMKYKILTVLCIILAVIFFGNFLFNLPNYLAAKVVGALGGKS